MATYDEWNKALLSYFVAGLPRGTSVYLAVDEEALTRIGRELQLDQEHPEQDFLAAVREVVVRSGAISLEAMRGVTKSGEPKGIAFLGAMVLAASRMADGEAISQLNYFRRLRQVLGLELESGRPRGLEPGTEVNLWNDWALWLQAHALLPSARGGGGAHAYISYPISQALLRVADKSKLCWLFSDRSWPHTWDTQTLLTQVRREVGTLTQHLQELLGSTGQRYQAVTEAIYDVYEAWQTEYRAGEQPRITHLLAGLYRIDDPLSGQISYYVYPKMPRRLPAESISVQISGATCVLAEERPGWFMPVQPVPASELGVELRSQIVQPSLFDYLILPKHSFWVLIPDAEQPESGIYASWDSPALGQHFIVLCSTALVPQLEQLRSDKLIDWNGAPHPCADNDQWVEVRDCMVLSPAWSGTFIEEMELYDALRPRSSLSVSRTGGLRVPRVAKWLDGHGPNVTVFGFPTETDVKIIDIAKQKVIVDCTQRTNVPLEVAWPGPGSYRVEAEHGSDFVQSLVEIVAWGDLPLGQTERHEAIELGDWRVCGGLIEPRIPAS